MENKKKLVSKSLRCPIDGEALAQFMGKIPRKARFRYVTVTPAPTASDPEPTKIELLEARWLEKIA